MSVTAVDAGRVRAAVASVSDPEYPDLTIADLGILERVEVDGRGVVSVALVPTVLGCPALDVIEADVDRAARAAGAIAVDVTFLTSPSWTPDRIAPAARRFLAREMTVAIRGRDGAVTCPLCGSTAVSHRSDFGPTVCRQLWWCDACRNPVEVIRR